MIAMPRERNLTLTSALPLRVKVCKGLFHPRVSNKASFQTMGLGFGNGICDTAAWKQTCLLPCLFICWERDKVVMCRKHDPAPLPNSPLSFCTRCRFEVCPPPKYSPTPRCLSPYLPEWHGTSSKWSFRQGCAFAPACSLMLLGFQ